MLPQLPMPQASFDEMLALEPHGPDVFVGSSSPYPWGRVYGGQVVAQALEAAIATVDDEHHPHSLHGYFIRGGTSDEPIRFEVDRIRNGRSFLTRRVVARQSSGAIFNLSASFQVIEGDADVTTCHPPEGIPGPDELDDESWTTTMARRPIPADALGGQTGAWLRVHQPVGERRSAGHLAVAYLSDDVPYDAAASVHPDRPGDQPEDLAGFMGASLDHSLWFHRSAPADEWQLHLLQPMGFANNRGLAFGQVFSHSGVHLASVTQEIVMRPDRNAP